MIESPVALVACVSFGDPLPAGSAQKAGAASQAKANIAATM
jgi:hypothetical protein